MDPAKFFKGDGMNLLQQYLKLLDVRACDIADAAGLGYHSVQKTIKGLRHHVQAQEAIAKHLGVQVSDLWGPRSERRLRRLIADRMELVARQYRRQLRHKTLTDDSNLSDGKGMGNG